MIWNIWLTLLGKKLGTSGKKWNHQILCWGEIFTYCTSIHYYIHYYSLLHKLSIGRIHNWNEFVNLFNHEELVLGRLPHAVTFQQKLCNQKYQGLFQFGKINFDRTSSIMKHPSIENYLEEFSIQLYFSFHSFQWVCGYFCNWKTQKIQRAIEDEFNTTKAWLG